MSLDLSLENRRNIESNEGEQDFLPFASTYLEEPKVIGAYDRKGIGSYTSVTVCTFKLIPLIDDGD